MFVCMYGKIADRLVHWGVVKYIHILVYTRPKQPSNPNNLPNNTWPKLPLHTEPEAPLIKWLSQGKSTSADDGGSAND